MITESQKLHIKYNKFRNTVYCAPIGKGFKKLIIETHIDSVGVPKSIFVVEEVQDRKLKSSEHAYQIDKAIELYNKL